jgi:hypothetical protein
MSGNSWDVDLGRIIEILEMEGGVAEAKLYLMEQYLTACEH